LTDITFISLPKVGDKLDANGRFGEIESVKATSDLYTGVAGTVSAVNEALNDEPGLINQDPYEKGWMIKLKADNGADVQKLLSSEDYLSKTGH
jgi:glycine cleavage system H protein